MSDKKPSAEQVEAAKKFTEKYIGRLKPSMLTDGISKLLAMRELEIGEELSLVSEQRDRLADRADSLTKLLASRDEALIRPLVEAMLLARSHANQGNGYMASCVLDAALIAFHAPAAQPAQKQG